MLGLVKLAEKRRPWRADDEEIEDVMGPIQPVTELPASRSSEWRHDTTWVSGWRWLVRRANIEI